MQWKGFNFRKKTKAEIEAPKYEPETSQYKTAVDVSVEFANKLNMNITNNEFRDILKGSGFESEGNYQFFSLLVSSKAIKELNDRIEKLEAQCKTDPKT